MTDKYEDWNGLQVKRIELDEHGSFRAIEFYEGAGLTDVMRAITRYKINGGYPRAVEEAVLLNTPSKNDAS